MAGRPASFVSRECEEYAQIVHRRGWALTKCFARRTLTSESTIDAGLPCERRRRPSSKVVSRKVAYHITIPSIMRETGRYSLARWRKYSHLRQARNLKSLRTDQRTF